MIILDVNKVSMNYGYGQLFEEISFSLNEGESISIVGPNGCGKSTLLKIIAGIEKADNGQINIKKGAKVAYLDQTGSSVVDDRPVYDILKDAFTELREKEQQIARLQKKMESGIEEDVATSLIIGATAAPVISRLPMEFLVESKQLIQMAMSKE